MWSPRTFVGQLGGAQHAENEPKGRVQADDARMETISANGHKVADAYAEMREQIVD